MRTNRAVLSWNMKCGYQTQPTVASTQRRLNLLAALIKERNLTIVALQESPTAKDVRLAIGGTFDLIETTGSVVIAYDTRHWSSDYKSVTQPRVAVMGLRPIGASSSLWVFNIHGPALYQDEYDKGIFVRTIVAPILRERRVQDSARLDVIAGDMNMPPFDHAVVREDGLNANRCLPWARKHGSGINRALFNPTWNILGRSDRPNGTFYSSRVRQDGPWYATDQLLLSAALVDVPSFVIDTVESVSGCNLRKKGPLGAPDADVGSDHLPLYATISV